MNSIHYLNFPQPKKQPNIPSVSIENYVTTHKPSIPVHFIRPHSIKKAAQWFLSHFSGDSLYAVKSNSNPAVLTYLFEAGIRHFDVASLCEIELVKGLFPEASLYFMHPIKSREAIYQAYFKHGIRDFSLDSFDELKKIQEVTNQAKDLALHVRLAIPNSHAIHDLSGKFGVLPADSISLLRKCRTVAKTLGISFHVGSQCMEPTEYRNAIMIVKDILEHSKVKLDVLDVGGGFPSSYPGLVPPPLSAYIDEINHAVKLLPLHKDCKLWCEPGRALVAESGSLLVRVEARKKNMLYINDGTYGGLFDAGSPGFIFPTKAMRVKKNKGLSGNLAPFGFYGPTCDSIDTMKGPFYLPENIVEGDYIEIGQLGAYSQNIRTEFNGFHHTLQVEVEDMPWFSMYEDQDFADGGCQIG